jgi:hypothetical protein
MKAKHIIEALAVMKEVESHLNTYPEDRITYQDKSWRLFDKLSDARIRLLTHSGISEIQIEVEAA